VKCPKCKFDHESQSTECLRCGIVFSKYVGEQVQPSGNNLPSEDSRTGETELERRREFVLRTLALPCALIGARLAVHIAPGAVRLLSMWIHECGHAVAAWLCGYPAFPGPWFTPVSGQRSTVLSLMLIGALGLATFQGWQRRQWLWVGAGALLSFAVIYCTGRLYSDQAQQLFIFGGDAGCFVLGSILMSTLYAGKGNPLRERGLRWGFMVIGALTFMDAFATWSGGIDRIPFGENENGMSDPSVLTELYSWNVRLLMDRYYRLAVFSLMALGVVYVVGLIQTLPSALRAERSLPAHKPGYLP